MTVGTGSRIVGARPSMKLITPTATETTPAAAKTVILRITVSPNANTMAADTISRDWLTFGLRFQSLACTPITWARVWRQIWTSRRVLRWIHRGRHGVTPPKFSRWVQDDRFEAYCSQK